MVWAEVSGVVTGPKAVVVSISVVVSDLAEDSDAEISMVVGTGSGVDAGWLAADDDATAEARTVVEEAAVESPRGDVSGVESSSIDIVIADRDPCSASPADEAPPALSSAVPRPSMLALNSHF